MINKDIINKKLDSLSKSKFRSSFKLSDNDKKYIINKGMDTIIEHAYSFINERLVIFNNDIDGKQTPMKNHPVFIAQHATGTCCRGCLYKWHGISKNKKLNNNEVNYVVNIIVTWMINEMRDIDLL